MGKLLAGIVILFLILIGVSLFFLLGKKPTATINNHTFTLFVAKTPKEKEVGLSEKTSLDKGSGMVFPFETPGYYAFWMKNMHFPIDILFIHADHIVTLYKNVQPPQSATASLPTYQPTEPADIVLELAAGTTDADNIKTGDQVYFKNLDTNKK